MRLNWLAYNYRPWDGYGRYSLYMILALRDAGVEVWPEFIGCADAPAWLRSEWAVDFNAPTISCLPPYYLRKLPKGAAPHWLLTMTEGSECPDGWAKIINESGVERVIVPCEHNAEAFRRGGVQAPISVIPGGTDPDEFPLLERMERIGKNHSFHGNTERIGKNDSFPASSDVSSGAKPLQGMPYTFLALADRGKRKGFSEAYQAFFQAFGSVDDTGPNKVRLIIKCRPGGNDLIDFIVEKLPPDKRDPRIVFLRDDLPNIADFYALGDCFVIPSRSEGWGMPHREAAMMGLPVITQAYSGMDDGHTEQWAIVVEKGRMEPVETLYSNMRTLLEKLSARINQGETISDDEIASLQEHVRHDSHLKGEWRVCDRDELAETMLNAYQHPNAYRLAGKQHSAWLRANQTWDHSAAKLIALMQECGVMAPVPEREYAWPI